MQLDLFIQHDEENLAVAAVALRSEMTHYTVTKISGENLDNVEELGYASHREAQLAFNKIKKELGG